MPLNLAQTAISVLRLGENALTAIYSGITRVYPNEVTVSIDGANASTQSGTPGQSMNNLIYIVTPSTNYAWTDAQIAAATLVGLPTGFTATLAVSGSLGSQSGTWNINTTDGLLPAVDTAITVASLTSNISETGYGTLTVNWSGASGSSTTTRTGFAGTSVSVGYTNVGYTPIGTLYTGVSGSVTLSGGQSFTSSSVSGNNSYLVSASATYTMSAGSTSSSLSVSSSQSTFSARGVNPTIPAPPWSVNPTTGILCNVNVYFDNNSQVIDPRSAWRLDYEWTRTSGGGASSGTGGFSNANGTAPQTYPGSNIFYSANVGPGTGTYTLKLYSNAGITGPGGNTWALGNPNVTKTWNWTY